MPIDFEWVHRELRRTGVTPQLLGSEHAQIVPQGATAEPYQYNHVCARVAEWRKKLDVVTRQVHRDGEKGLHRLLGQGAASWMRKREKSARSSCL